ncbi:MAG: RnfABCDGE type electron transport complex subunit G [Rikenellaceae bacterium]
MKSSLKNMVMVLMLITLIASAAVGVVFQLTEEPIEAARSAKITNAIKEVMPEFDEVSEGETLERDGGEMVVYKATKGGQVVGYAIQTFSKEGYGGEIKLLIGFLPDGTINKAAVISHKETPGLGDKIDKSKSNFSLQFEGKNPAKFKLGVKKDGKGDVDAITASTISSRAYVDAVKRAYELAKEQK